MVSSTWQVIGGRVDIVGACPRCDASFEIREDGEAECIRWESGLRQTNGVGRITIQLGQSSSIASSQTGCPPRIYKLIC